ncbi:MAG: hypothetical protein ACRDVE_18100 [Actinocrinis sp.]
MTSETAPTKPPAILLQVEHSARRVAELDAERAAEKQRRDQYMSQAEKDGYTYREIAAAARRGDGQATISVVYKAVTDYA